MAKLAVVLLNLGGPDRVDAVQPFLFNLFSDPAILRVPQPLRWLLAQIISRRRAPVAQEIYAHLGGRSPLLEQTKAQAEALEQTLNAQLADDGQLKVFIAMRYWHPFALETAQAVKGFDPDHIILLPLYPQFSTTTTGSSFTDWDRAAARVGLNVKAARICCYPTATGFIDAHVDALLNMAGAIEASEETAALNWRVLFSAHGLPKKIVDAGDPYQHQVEMTVSAVLERIHARGIEDGLESVICYQSRVGPLEWIGPSTEDEIQRAGKDGVGIVVVPIAFVSEHSETLVELDIEYQKLAEESGVPAYRRVPTIGIDDNYMDCLAGLVATVVDSQQNQPLPHQPQPASGDRFCPQALTLCPCEGKGV